MKIVIADYPDVLGRELEKEFAFLREDIPDAEIVVHPYRDAALFYREMADADGLLTAFLPLDKARSTGCRACARYPSTRPATILSIWKKPGGAASRSARLGNTVRKK